MPKKKKLPKSVLHSKFYRDTTRAVPVDVWKACLTAYQAAARMTMPVTNPMEYKVRMEGAVYGFTDTPMNRGMVALKEFLRKEQMDLFPAIASRIMALGGLMSQLRSEERFATFFKADSEDGAFMVSEALLDAFATAPFVPRTMDLDLDAVHTVASKLLAEET